MDADVEAARSHLIETLSKNGTEASVAATAAYSALAAIWSDITEDQRLKASKIYRGIVQGWYE